MRPKLPFIFFVFSFLWNTSFSQDSDTGTSVFPQYISGSFGTGMFSVKDYYFSDQKYSGSMPAISFQWMRRHKNYGYRMGFDFSNSDRISNYTMPATVTRFSLYQDFLYSLGRFRLFNKDVFVFLGPSTDIYFYFNQQQFAESGIYFDFSFLAMISACADAFFVIPVGKRLSVESNLGLNVFSLGIQMPEVVVDNNEEAESAMKLLTVFNGLKSGFDFGVRYHILNRLSVRIAYDLKISNVTVRKKILTVYDNFAGSIAYHF